MKKKKIKKIGREMISRCRIGEGPYHISSSLNMSIKQLGEAIQNSDKLKSKIRIAYSKYQAYWGSQMRFVGLKGRMISDLNSGRISAARFMILKRFVYNKDVRIFKRLMSDNSE